MPAKPAPPRKSKDPRPSKIPNDELRFIRHYVDEGAIRTKVAVAEKKARVPAGAGAKFLKKKRVQNEIKRRMEPIRLAEQSQKVVGAVVATVTAKLTAKTAAAEAAAAAADKELTAIMALPAMYKVDTVRLEDALMRLAIGLDPTLHPQVKLDAIKAGLVVAGVMEWGSTKRSAPLDMPDSPGTPGMYQSLAIRVQAEKAAAVPAEAKAAEATPPTIEQTIQPGQDGVFDLMPDPGKPKAPEATKTVAVVLPPPGEPITHTARRAPDTASHRSTARVITVNVG